MWKKNIDETMLCRSNNLLYFIVLISRSVILKMFYMSSDRRNNI